MNNETNTSTTPQPTLKRALGLGTGVLLVAGMMIGSGVFKKIVPMAQTGLSETWIILAWISAGLITMFGAFTLAGLSDLTEESGGVYEYLRLSFGNFFSFLFGWTDFTIIGCASVAALGFIFAQTVNVFIPLGNPFHSLAHISIGDFIFPFADGGIKLLAIVAIVLLTWINYRGVQNGGLVNNIITSAKIIGILLLIVLGLSHASANETATIITNKPATELHGMALFSAVLAAMLSAFWAYDGWSNISFIAGEIKNPKRNIPIAIMSGVAIAMLLYVLINMAYMHVLPLQTLKAVDDSQIGAAIVAETLLGKVGQSLIVILIMISVFGTLNGIILAHARIYYRMAQEKFFFKKAATVHPVYRTPSVALLYTMIWSCILVLSGTFDMLTNMVIFAGFLFYSLVVIALFKMKRNGTIKTKVIGYPFIPAFVGLFSVALLVNTVITQPVQSLIGLGLVLSGVLFYAYFRKQHGTG
ncbi:amino acid permease [Lacibacter luteus]|uniref:Amino acid permease n=1 Tax=Lacibacter luteus TaxID=2508719 RepID=A0A4Q1CJQ1_9BACT|nr:amino acid permease [Lacibacter luteus]RXK60813.1 amino acid permease [Lacibacter luteus]